MKENLLLFFYRYCSSSQRGSKIINCKAQNNRTPNVNDVPFLALDVQNKNLERRGEIFNFSAVIFSYQQEYLIKLGMEHHF